MIEPWERECNRLGIRYQGPTATQPTQSISWALLRVRPEPPEKSGVARRADLIALARQAVRDGAAGVTLYLYKDDASFADSRAAAEGMSRGDHAEMINEAAHQLRGEGIDVEIEWIWEQRT